jgi:protein involved in polysaccharide export with SLBB domain
MYPLLVEGKVDNKEASMKMQDGDLLIIPELDAKYFVSGQVNRPTTMFLPEARTVTVTQALSDGGGPTQNADLKRAGIMRMVNGEKTWIPVNLHDLLTKPDAKIKKDKMGKPIVQNYVLQDGDTLYVPVKGKGFSIQDITSPIWALSLLGFRLN